ncbi:MAG: STAS domain-containing protein [Lachnospiraceae bacterium]|nr:STAS domain-containing protein [Lachnospiraceae bacterium]
MDIQVTKKEGTLLIDLTGRLDTTSSPQLEKTLKKEIGDSECLIFDFAGLSYISSAGLRVLLSAQKVMNRQGKMVIRHVNEEIMDIFEVTGFVDILTVEQD